jgi:hypothetical protein
MQSCSQQDHYMTTNSLFLTKVCQYKWAHFTCAIESSPTEQNRNILSDPPFRVIQTLLLVQIFITLILFFQTLMKVYCT